MKSKNLTLREKQAGEDVVSAVEDAVGVNRTQWLYGKSRDKENVNCRAIASYILADHEGISMTRVANILRIDHSSVIYFRKKVTDDWMAMPKLFKLECAALDDAMKEYSARINSDTYVDSFGNVWTKGGNDA